MSDTKSTYRVLARKYRPATFSELIGQDVLVRTLTNAINTNRIAHAFVLTGIRGVGKTTTARIIAKALNCVGADGKGNMTADPCGVCDQCVAITESRHVDVLEMDAASRTGVGDIREIIDTVRYAPSSARYKVYIIDEVHMLSKAAFNALLKTLEEPPPHVVFVFATTEVRKIPVTILSRCQRFDLPRVELEQLVQHLKSIAVKESVKVDDDALFHIAAAAQGSVRDSLSLFDQAIAHSEEAGKVSLAEVQKMLGLVSREQVYTLFEQLVSGNVREAILSLQSLYQSGADPLVVLQDMLEITHFITQVKILPELSKAPHIPEGERHSAKALSEKLGFPYLARCWQMLLKGVSEAQLANNTLMAAEMVIARLAYVADVPPPGDLIRDIEKNKNENAAPSLFENKAPARVVEPVAVQEQPSPVLAVPPTPIPVKHIPNPTSFKALVELFREQGEHFLYNYLQNDVHLVDFKPPKVEIHLSAAAPKDLPNKAAEYLRRWTGERWLIILSHEQGKKTLVEEKQEVLDKRKTLAAEHADVKAVLGAFPGATILKIEEVAAPETSSAELADEQSPAASQE
jgi:DNA polymerase-3 subunit gamma/tau